MKRSGSAHHQFVQRIPADVLGRVAGAKLAIPIGGTVVPLTVSAKARDVRVSLRTSDKAEARRRQAQVSAYLGTVWQAFRADTPVTLSHRQATALAGRLYRAWANGTGRERTTSATLAHDGTWLIEHGASPPSEDEAAFGSALERLNATMERGEPSDLEPPLGPLVDRLLLAEGIAAVDPESRAMLLTAFALALRDAFERRHREAGGDYRPDPKSERFPEWRPPETAARELQAAPSGPAASPSLTGLVEAWWREASAAGRKPSTRESYTNSMAALVAFLGHDDPRRVTPEDVVRFKDHRLACVNPRTGRPISAKTVKDSDLAGLKTVFGWAVANRLMPSNPAAGLTIRVGKAPRLRSKGFTEGEALAILSAALHHQPGAERPWTAAAKRWVPFLSAYTGARVGELGQLRKQDLRREGVHWAIRITPEAGTVKTNEARDVVLHPHLVEQGFPAFVEAAPPGHLFLRPARDGDVLGPLQGLKNRLAEFARAVVPDPNVAPNHGWRHRFKTVGREAGIDGRVLDAIQGQAPRTVAESYGDVSLKTIAAAVERLPRYETDARTTKGSRISHPAPRATGRKFPP